MVYCGFSMLFQLPGSFSQRTTEATLLEAHAPAAQLHSCPANLITAPWEEQLLLRGFAKDAPTMWLLEGTCMSKTRGD